MMNPLKVERTFFIFLYIVAEIKMGKIQGGAQKTEHLKMFLAFFVNSWRVQEKKLQEIEAI